MACMEVETPICTRFRTVEASAEADPRAAGGSGHHATSEEPSCFPWTDSQLGESRTENFLKHKIRSRPERAELIRMHILQETGAEPSLQATQMRLKRARLADNLNEMISQRPGPMELVEKNILPVDSSVKQAIIGQVNYPKVLEEDSSEALSPEQPASQESQASVPSPAESRVPETPPPAPAAPLPPAPAAPPLPPVPPPMPNTMLQSFPNTTKATTDFMKLVSAIETPRPAVTQPPAPHKPAPTLVKQSQQKSPSEKSRSKKNKEPKSRVKKLKYHQYVPPDQKLETILPAPLKPVAEGQSSIMVSLAPPSSSDAPSALRPNNSLSNRKPGVLPANLEEMKVAELKLELKLRGLPVSGTKTDLIERLKPFQENHNTSAPTNNSISTTNMQMEVKTSVLSPHENMNPTSPLSPIPSDRSTQDGGKPETPSFETHMVTSNWTPTFQSFQIPQEKDMRLHEKEQQIVELMKKWSRSRSWWRS
ncbi:Myocardin-related transcription factor B [Dissostichus eleginoides]|uniref:Myocardin-related transcription factor B n=1 Tax=Dissostichus eleginoides TaxID=100907 RepID=A0AAD9F0I5_DISEL|nr:Myocardin-related transcription factor B [Dissostichus eleginoides]